MRQHAVDLVRDTMLFMIAVPDRFLDHVRNKIVTGKYLAVRAGFVVAFSSKSYGIDRRRVQDLLNLCGQLLLAASGFGVYGDHRRF